MDCSPQGSSVQGILQAGILEWVAMPSSRRSSQPRDWSQVSCTVVMLYCLSHERSSHSYMLLPKISLEEENYIVWRLGKRLFTIQIRLGYIWEKKKNSKGLNKIEKCIFYVKEVQRKALQHWSYSPIQLEPARLLQAPHSPFSGCDLCPRSTTIRPLSRKQNGRGEEKSPAFQEASQNSFPAFPPQVID